MNRTLHFDGGRIRLQTESRELSVNGAAAGLGGRTLEVLLALLQRRGHLASTDELLRAVWPGQVVEPNTLQVHVLALRKLFGSGAILTVRGRGYQWVLAPDPDPQAELIGRDALLARAQALLQAEGTRLLTLFGPGGVGKSRLAQALVARAETGFAHGSCSVELAAEADPARLADAVALARGLQPLGATPLAEALLAHLQPQQILLCLDNFEHLAAAAPQLQSWLDAAPGLRIVVTSRRALGLPGEQLLEVPPLDVPAAPADEGPSDRDVQGPAGVAADEAPALTLLRRRAAAIGHDPALEPGGLPAAAEVCRRLDGLPLALELAAARLRVLSMRALLARLDLPLQTVGGGVHQAPTRHRSLGDVLDDSIALLTPGARALYCALAVFAGGSGLDAAVAVAGGGDRAGTLDALDELLAHSLLQRRDGLDGEPRFTMLATVREHARQRAEATGLWPALQQAHLAWHLALAEGLLPRWSGPGRVGAGAALEAEAANLEQALANALRPGGTAADAAAALRLGWALAWWWYFSGRLAAGRQWLQRALQAAGPDADAALRARALCAAGKLAVYQLDGPATMAQSQQAIELAGAAGDPATVGWALFHQGIATIPRSAEHSAALFDAARARFDAAGDAWASALARVYSGIPFAFRPGHETLANERLRDGQRLLQAWQDEWGCVVADAYLAMIALRQGDLAAAQMHQAEVLRVATALGDGYRIGMTRHQLGRVAMAAGRWAAAAEHLHAAVDLHRRQGREGYATALLAQLARVALRLGDAKLAARLAGAAQRPVGPMLPMLVGPDELAAADAARQRLRERLGGAAFERLQAEGRGWTLAQALAAARPLVQGVASTGA